MSAVEAIIIILIIIGAVYLAWRWAHNTFCSIPVVGWLCGLGGGGAAQGAACSQDWNCAGWSVFGDVACCSNTCITKDSTFQTCDEFCQAHPTSCGASTGCESGYCDPPTCQPCSGDDSLVPGTGCVSTGGRHRYVSPAASARGCPQRHTLEDLRRADLLLRVTPWKQS